MSDPLEPPEGGTIIRNGRTYAWDRSRKAWVPLEIYEARKYNVDTPEFTRADTSRCWNQIYTQDCYSSMLLTLANDTSRDGEVSEAIMIEWINTG